MCIQMHRIAMNDCQKIMMCMAIKTNKILFRRNIANYMAQDFQCLMLFKSFSCKNVENCLKKIFCLINHEIKIFIDFIYYISIFCN